MIKCKIADVVFSFTPIYDLTARICQQYLYNGKEKASFSVVITQEDIDREKLSDQKTGSILPDDFLESLALFRKLCNYILSEANGIVFHSSAVAVDGEAYLFTAPSGTGKSTHTRLWRELLGEKAVMVNDDKPIVRFVDNEFYVYGTPWNGKHRIGNNCRAKVKAICALKRSSQNVIRKISPKEILPLILNQTLRPKEANLMENLLVLIDKLLKSVSLYELGCNMDISAAQLSYSTMSKGENNVENS